MDDHTNDAMPTTPTPAGNGPGQPPPPRPPAAAGGGQSPPPGPPVISRPPGAVLADVRAKWAAQTRRPQKPLNEVRLDANERLLIPFTSTAAETHIHYVEYRDLCGYWACNGPGCLLCRLGKKVDDRDLLPVYDVEAEAVAVLPVGPSFRLGALAPFLAPVFDMLDAGKRVLLAVSKPDRTRYAVSVMDLRDGEEDGAAAIARFKQAFENDEVDLAAIYRRMSNETLARVPEIAKLMKLRGITP